MKKFIFSFQSILFLLSFCWLNNSALHAQSASSPPNSSARKAGWWTFGINGGLAYQTSDISPNILDGYGGGLTLAKNFYYQPGAALSFDLRGRLLLDCSFGSDSKSNAGIVYNNALNSNGLGYSPTDKIYQNYRTVMGELGIEGVFTFNRLRERKGIVFSLFGGVGLNWYGTKIDQKNSLGTYRNLYNGINSTASTTEICQQLTSGRDGVYESNADGYSSNGKLGLMPSAGFELGYMLAPHFMVGIGHKITFPLNNVLDGQQWQNNSTASVGNDLAHYTYLQFAWEFYCEESRPQPPIINMINPRNSPQYTDRPVEAIQAEIRNTNSSADVTYTINNAPQRFNFYSKNFNADATLREGANQLLITASNPYGKAERAITIYFQPRANVPQPPPPPIVVVPAPPPPPPAPPTPPSDVRPDVRFLNPERSPMTVRKDEIIIRAVVRGARSAENIRYYMNGEEDRSFSFNNQNGILSSRTRLREGNNTFRVEVRNNAGTDEATASVIYQNSQPQLPSVPTPAPPPPPQLPSVPTVNITMPSNSPYTSPTEVTTIRASIKNITGREDIYYYVNGRTSNKFNYEPRSGQFSSEIPLNTGRNEFRISASNRAGQGGDQVTVIYQPKQADPPPPPPASPKPQVRIEQPTNASVFSEATAIVRATVQNISVKNDIIFTVNGVRNNDFEYNNFSRTMTANIALVAGNNKINIKAQNISGSDEKTVDVAFLKAIVKEEKPQVTITAPKDGSTLATTTTNIAATLQRVIGKENVKILVNGREISNFTLDKLSRNVRADNVQLNIGNNEIRVQVSNKTGTAEAVSNVRCSVPPPSAPKPTVTITSVSQPTVDPFKPDEGKSTILALLKGISSRDQVTFTVNGKVITAFDLNLRISGNFQATFDLIKGDNIIVLKVVTPVGSDEKTSTVKF